MKVFLILIILSAGGQKDTMKLDELIPILLKVNPRIASAKAEVEAYKTLPSSQSSPPNPIVFGKVRNEGDLSLNNEMMSSAGVMVEQKVPFPLKLIKRYSAWKYVAEAKMWEYEAVKLNVIRKFKEVFYELWFLNEKLNILKHTLSLMRDLRETALSLYRAGLVPQENAIRIQVEILKVEEEINDVEIEIEKKVWELASFLRMSSKGLTGYPSIDEPVFPELQPEDILSLTLERNPLIKERKALLKAEEEFLKEAKVDYFPDIVLSGGWEKRFGFENVWEARVGIEIPLYFWQKEMKKVKERKMKKIKEEHVLDDVKEKVVGTLKGILFSYRTNLKILNLYRNSIVPQAESAFASALSLYRTGKGGFINTVENLLSLLNSRIEEKDRLKELLKDTAKLEEITGMGDSLWKEVKK